MQLPLGERPIGQREQAETEARGRVFDKIRSSRSEGRTLVVWSPEECEALKDLLVRLAAVKERTGW